MVWFVNFLAAERPGLFAFESKPRIRISSSSLMAVIPTPRCNVLGRTSAKKRKEKEEEKNNPLATCRSNEGESVVLRHERSVMSKVRWSTDTGARGAVGPSLTRNHVTQPVTQPVT